MTTFEDSEGFEITMGEVTVDEVLQENVPGTLYYVRGRVVIAMDAGVDEYDIAFCVGTPSWMRSGLTVYFLDPSDHRSTGFGHDGVTALESHLLERVGELFDASRRLAQDDD